MNEDQIIEIWMMFEHYVEKKHMNLCVEKFIDIVVDFGADDNALKSCLGHSQNLDQAIYYYLDLDSEDEENYNDEWD